MRYRDMKRQYRDLQSNKRRQRDRSLLIIGGDKGFGKAKIDSQGSNV